jgi:hypothetical protein
MELLDFICIPFMLTDPGYFNYIAFKEQCNYFCLLINVGIVVSLLLHVFYLAFVWHYVFCETLCLFFYYNFVVISF